MIIKGLTIAKKPRPFSSNEDRCAVSSVQAKRISNITELVFESRIMVIVKRRWKKREVERNHKRVG